MPVHNIAVIPRKSKAETQSPPVAPVELVFPGGRSRTVRRKEGKDEETLKKP